MTDRFYRIMRDAIVKLDNSDPLLLILDTEKAATENHNFKIKKVIDESIIFDKKTDLNSVTVTGVIKLGHTNVINRDIVIFNPNIVDMSKDLIKAYFVDMFLNTKQGNDNDKIL